MLFHYFLYKLKFSYIAIYIIFPACEFETAEDAIMQAAWSLAMQVIH